MENANICYSVKYLQCACMGNVFAFFSALYSYAVHYCSHRKFLFHLTGALKGVHTQTASSGCSSVQTAAVSEHCPSAWQRF